MHSRHENLQVDIDVRWKLRQEQLLRRSPNTANPCCGAALQPFAKLTPGLAGSKSSERTGFQERII
jgi:hypothetical protein